MSSIGIGTIGIVSLALALGNTAAGAGDAWPGWENLRQLQPGDRIRVVSTGKPTVTAEFAAVTPDGLQLVRSRKEQIDLRRPEIRGVYLLRRSPVRAAAPWIGLAAGFAAGFAAGYSHGHSAPVPPAAAIPAGRSMAASIRPKFEGFISAPSFSLDVSRPVAGAIGGAAGAAAGALAGHLAAGDPSTVIYIAP